MRNILSKIFLLFNTILLTSCLVVKPYKKPTVKTDNLYNIDSVFKDTTSIASISWDQLFTDSILQGYVKTAITNNFDMQIAIQNLIASNSQMLQAKNIYFPELKLNLQQSTQQFSLNSQFGRLFSSSPILNQYELSTNLSWELDIWGKLRSTRNADIAKFLSVKFSTYAIQTQLIADIAVMYYQLLALDEQLQVLEESLQNRIESVVTIQALFKAGNSTKVAVLQTEAQRYTTEITTEKLKYNIKTTEHAFCTLIGEAPHKVVRNHFRDQKIIVDLKVGIPSLLLSQRPDVMASEFNLRSAFELTNVAKTNFYPALTISATGGLQSLNPATWFSEKSFFSTLISGLAQPIFLRRRLKTAHEIARANQQIALLNFQKTLINAGKEVSNGIATYENTAVTMVIIRQQVDVLKQAEEYSDQLLKSGSINYLEVITAKDKALSAQLQLIDNRFQQMQSLVYIYRALGGGYKDTNNY